MIHPWRLTPDYVNFFKPILFMASDSSSGFRRGISHFFTATKVQPREWKEESKRTNTDLGQLCDTMSSIYAHICIHPCVCTHTCVRVCVYIYIYIYARAHVCVHTHTHTHIHTYTYLPNPSARAGYDTRSIF